jgi:dihydroorotase (multifunctional complex type)
MSGSLHDLVVDCDAIYTGSRVFAGRVVVDDGKVTALVGPDDDTAGRRRIDASGKHVIPGLIDTHCHFRDPGFTHKEDIASATRLAALGGVTCVYDMPNTKPAVDSIDRLEEHREYFAQRSFVDFGHNVSPVNVAEMEPMAKAGATAFKIWTSYDIGRTYPHVDTLAVTDTKRLYEVFEQALDVGLPVYAHPTDHGLYAMFAERSRAEWGLDFRSYARALRRGNNVVIDLSIATLLEVQRSVGTRLHVLHLNSEHGIELVAAAKAAGRAVTAETNPFAMFLANDWDTIERIGPFALGQWVPAKDSVAMWDAVRDGVIDVIASDHAPHTREEKEPGWQDMYAAPGGAGPFIGHYLALLLDAVHQGHLTMQRLVELCCDAPARLTGTTGQKGSLEPGADADFVVIDMAATTTLSVDTVPYKCGWLANEGRVVHGWPTTTVLRGEIIADDGQVLSSAGSGRFVAPARAVV